MEVLKLEVEKLWNQYNFYLERADPRVEKWPLMHSYYPTILFTITYLFAVKVGMMMMANRKPLPCQWLISLYNLSLIALNYHIFYELITTSYAQSYNYLCQPVDYSDNPQSIRIARALWWFYISKLIEFSDTFFFIARKKSNQVTFLHIYHHATMFPLWWIGVKWVPGGQSVVAALINSLVHIVMYLYYFLASLGPSLRKFLWWKRYLTILQLIQFVVGVGHAGRSIYSGCDFPLWMQWALIFYGLSIFCLFINFYFKTYLARGGCGKEGGGEDGGKCVLGDCGGLGGKKERGSGVRKDGGGGGKDGRVGGNGGRDERKDGVNGGVERNGVKYRGDGRVYGGGGGNGRKGFKSGWKDGGEGFGSFKKDNNNNGNDNDNNGYGPSAQRRKRKYY